MNSDPIAESTNKPFSQACENNKVPIFNVLQPLLENCRTVLEIGAGTGQHAAYFATQMPQLQWQSSDRAKNIDGIKHWTAAIDNALSPLVIDVLQYHWQLEPVDAIYSANSCHIMSWQAVEALFAGIAKILKPNGYCCLYGPFVDNGEYSSVSNRQFDQFLRARDPQSGLRDIQALHQLARRADLKFIDRHYLPANNEILVWGKL